MMRLNSLLFVALHFACFHTSSTRSMSTSGNITEERMFGMSALGESAEGIIKKLPEAEEKMMLSPVRFKYRTDFSRSSRLHNYEVTRKLLKSWISVLRQDRKRIKKATKELLTRIEYGSDGTIIDALREANVDKKTWNMVGDVMIKYWKDQKKSSVDVFELLNLQGIHSTYTPAELNRFEMWVKFSTEKPDMSIVDVCENFYVGFRFRILDGLRLMEGTQKVKSMEAALSETLEPLNKSFVRDILKKFLALELDKDLEKLRSHSKLKIFNEYVARDFPKALKGEAFIEASRSFYGNKEVGDMLFTAVKKKDADAEQLLKELFRQWENDVNHGIWYDGWALDELKEEYNAYVNGG